MLNYHQWGPMQIAIWQFHKRYLSHQSLTLAWKLPKISFNVLGADELTHWGRYKMDAILQTTFLNAISWMKMFVFRLKFHWSLFLKVQLTRFQWWPSSMTHKCATRPQWVDNNVRHVDAYSFIFYQCWRPNGLLNGDDNGPRGTQRPQSL